MHERRVQPRQSALVLDTDGLGGTCWGFAGCRFGVHLSTDSSVGTRFAAGAMLFVISDEMIPESHRKGFEREATFGLTAGFVIMMLSDCLFA